MKSTKGLSIIEASVVVALMLILALGGLIAGSSIIDKAEANDCVKNLGTLFSLQRTHAALEALPDGDAPGADVFLNVDQSAAFFCKSSGNANDRFTPLRMAADYTLGATYIDFPFCTTLGVDAAGANIGVGTHSIDL